MWSRMNHKNFTQILEKPYGRYLVILCTLTIFLHQLNIYVFTHIEQSTNEIKDTKISEKVKKQSEFVTLKPKDSNLDYQCQCKELQIISDQSLCSDYSNSRGNEQKVISVSHLGQDLVNLKRTVEEVYKHYPGYFLRIYHNMTETNEKYQELCDLFCLNDHVDLCHTMKIGQLSH